VTGPPTRAGAVHPFRFGVMASRAASASEWVALAQRAEALGYDTLLMPDHLGNQLSPFVALTAAAGATARLRVGPFVLANDYRHPLIVAREAATLDLLSGGRLELGLGAGWNMRDYRSLGLAYDRPGLRVDRLVESVGLISRLLAGETVDHDGPHYRLAAARLSPPPIQRPRPPILIGGGGPRILRLAARRADIVALQPQMDPRGRPIVRQATEAATAAKVALVREAAGERFDRLELNVIVADAGLVGGGSPPLASLSAAAKAAAVALIGTPYVMYGTLVSLRDVLLRRRERTGISYYALPARTMEAMAPLVEALAGR
jgi:probable F420-dependent oxidoreductase